jgi:hypothetical protein
MRAVEVFPQTPSFRGEAFSLMLFALRLAALLDHLAATVASTAFAHAMRAHKLAALRAHHQHRGIQALVLAAVATAVARNFRLWYGAHYVILDPFLNTANHTFYASSLISLISLTRPKGNRGNKGTRNGFVIAFSFFIPLAGS